MGTLLLCGALRLSAGVYPQTAFYWENPYSISPAFVFGEEAAFFSLAARKQWEGVEGSPATFFATATYYVPEWGMQTGMKLMADRIGYRRSTGVSVSYAYSVRLSRDCRMNMGIGGTWMQQATDRGEVVTGEANDPVWEKGVFDDRSCWDMDGGIEFTYNRRLVAGLSAQNLYAFVSRPEGRVWDGTVYVYARYRTRSLGRSFDRDYYRTRSFHRSFDMEYGLCVRSDDGHIGVDGMVTLYLNRHTQEEKYQFSLLGRSAEEVGVMAGMKLTGGLKLLGVYEYNLKPLDNKTGGSFEVMISYPLRRKRECKVRWDR